MDTLPNGHYIHPTGLLCVTSDWYEAQIMDLDPNPTPVEEREGWETYSDEQKRFWRSVYNLGGETYIIRKPYVVVP